MLRAAPDRTAISRRQSLYVPMRDGVKLAVDVHLPAAEVSAAGLPTILHQTRYYRGVRMRGGNGPLVKMAQRLESHSRFRRLFLERGYAWIDVCVRGSGASFGKQDCIWSPDEVADGRELVDWILKQPWSNGLVGATGNSYAGTAAELLLVHQHPAVRAVAPLFSLYDAYRDVACPGGVPLLRFAETWARLNETLDRHAYDETLAIVLSIQLRALAEGPEVEASPALAHFMRAMRNVRDHTRLRHLFRPLAAGIRPVTGYEHVLSEVARCHMENVDVYEQLCAITFSDDDFLRPDTLPDQGERSPSLFSPAFYADAIKGAGVPIFSVTGWYDGAYQHAAIRRFLRVRTPGSQLLIGPWHHGGRHNISPFRGPSSLPFDAALLLTDFFDHHLQGEAPPTISPVRYFTMGEERWKEANVWPPPDFSRECWYLTADRRLAPERPSSPGVHTQHVDPTTGTGHRSRWDSLLPLYVPADYPRRAERERDLAVYRSERLTAAMEVTGHPVVSIQLQTRLHDLFLFAYLEDEAPDGRIRHVTEGQLRALHRQSQGVEATGVPFRTFRRADGCPIEPGIVTELRFDLLPTSWLFAPGHRLRLALSGADCDHFADATPGDFSIQVGGEHPSCIELPVRRR